MAQLHTVHGCGGSSSRQGRLRPYAARIGAASALAAAILTGGVALAATITGTAGPDTINGTPEADTIHGAWAGTTRSTVAGAMT